ncbi:MAG: glutamate--tRNA ligase, partial [Rhodobacteraceae bacterium]|nr:glutamate--tRNA ligase [Paracoccaceae bacterium]
ALAEEIQEFRDSARAEGRSTLFQSPWRDVDPNTHPDAPYVVRIKSPETGVTIIQDQVQGDVTIKNDQLDDMVLLRSDGTPVYMLAVVVDDYDMGITHVIRGDDHLNNAARQMMIYNAMGWKLPVYAHLPLILGEDGKKLSKRHGATSVEDYQTMGYPAAGMRNYLARLGWSHGDDEFFTDEQAKEWFDFGGINKSAARFDFKKLQNLSGQHIAAGDDAALLQEILAYREKSDMAPLSDEMAAGLGRALYCVKDRAKTFGELIDKARFILVQRPLEIEEKAQKQLNSVSHSILEILTPQLHNVTWSREALEALVNQVAEAHEVGFGKVAGPLRAALAGQSVTPSVIDMMLVLGRDESVARLNDAKAQCHD